MANLDSLVVEIKADLTDIRKNMKNAVKVTRQSSKKMTDSNKLLAGGFNKVRIAAIAAAAGIIYMGKQTLKEVDRIQKLGKKLDTTTEFLSKMKFVAEQSGVAFEQLATGFTMMQRNIGDASEGVGEAKQAFEMLGIKAKKLMELSLENQFMVIAEALANTKNATTRTQVAMDIFGRSGSSLNQILKDGILSMKQLAETTPNVITQKDADRIATYNDNMNLLKRNIQGKMIPVLAKLAEKINKLFERSDEVMLRNLKMELQGIATKLELSERESSKAKHSFLNMAKSINKAEKDSHNYNKTLHDRKIAIQSEIEAIQKRAKVSKSLEGKSNIAPLPNKVIIDESVKGIKDDIIKMEKQAKESSTAIKDAMIGATDQWSSRLTDAILDGGNMFESLADIAKRTAIEMMITNPFIRALQGGINNLMTPSPTSGLSKGTNGITINTYNKFDTNVAASIREEIATAAPHIQAASIAGVQAALSNGQMRV
jgi:hypothetical protein